MFILFDMKKINVRYSKPIVEGEEILTKSVII